MPTSRGDLEDGLDNSSESDRKQKGRQDPPRELSWSSAQRVQLPPSPPSWEVDGREDFHREYDDPRIGPVYKASFARQAAKAVKLASALTAEEREGKVGEAIAQAFRKLIVQRHKAGQLAAAAKQTLEMIESVPKYVQDVDRRRFNRILGELRKAGKKPPFEPLDAPAPSATPPYALTSGSPWSLNNMESIPVKERSGGGSHVGPITSAGSWSVDGAPTIAERPDVKAVIRRLDSKGNTVAESYLVHDIYRTGSGKSPDALATMSADGLLHVYDAALKEVVASDLREDLRVCEHFRTIKTDYWGAFKSQLRNVDADGSRRRYLFTLADEAWCCDWQGRTLWGVSVPVRDGWQRATGNAERPTLDPDGELALRTLGLSLPVTQSDVKRQYRALALARHPDRNPNDPSAPAAMKELNLAFETLTGIAPEELEVEEGGTTHFRQTSKSTSAGGVAIHIGLAGAPRDWVYGASFGEDGGAFVATYSGKVFLLSSAGRVDVVYEIGTCPLEILESGRHTYFMTSTRLYVLEDRVSLIACLDVFRQGRLVVAESGFGLLAGNRLQWFTHSGLKVGELTARDPIRSIAMGADGAIVR